MAGIVSVSRRDLAQRRQKLRRQRRMKIIQTIWRTLAASGLAGGLLWMTIQPMWVLKAPTQIVMTSGNQLLSEQKIQSLLALSYPQSLWRLEPSAIAATLKQQPAIAQASVSRRLFPPGLMIEIQERLPVAMTYTFPGQKTTSCDPQSRTSEKSAEITPQPCLQNSNHSQQGDVGLLDASGAWMPLEKYTSLNPTSKLPSLKVIGLPEQYRSYWTQLYQAISQSSVKVTEIDFQDPTNLILKTELGNVHFGLPNTQVSEKIKVLVQMQHLPTKFNPGQIAYIDLKNPDYPLVQMHQKPKTNLSNP
ncbi:FtsQ-type POTRA domain-containing protein [Anabaena cylindrica FACHB-243]|uniref:Polypeptide-transport-associated domain protein FtsQ-type n=1 Tax=Anabaena cylindrica (strain ATCC 27899 / PCC 7122) TaxID=272123 RepID=K9ZAX8_ANACC|nr:MULTISPECIES: FtsQ-type POTRA domain-containing protein [Anabaena]AFZ55732.1 Polypeptide-transport-associated domain protein FtsQ-type [Anabaena cylindrica PCC 7122]MBD2420267.1 FtsQ-type POTRA domain-containing protein [Anabaena cylindrica FACHB-243]MBY5282121.1 FtsQ-type POTRA domain-containing protein [Anabaena sp. CCAP 1446/1C]MBY5309581.1 FtsQ-type POTRA domain-containing protein [Anabaena sp. CCAP 1446/1C]MCM2406079.1 FtsQ-type POTRA domain-containing protein [Anabaena sp. CCAP 1446/1